MEGSPNGLAPLAFNDLVRQKCGRQSGFLRTGVVLSLHSAGSHQNLSARANTTRHGEPLRHTPEQAIHLVNNWCSLLRVLDLSTPVTRLDRFGDPATNRVPYIECRKPEQLPRQADGCRTAKLRAYPTWDAAGRTTARRAPNP